MTIGYWLLPEDNSCEFHNNQWNHSFSPNSFFPLKSSVLKAWVSILEPQWHRVLVPGATFKPSFSPQVQNRKWRSSDHGSLGFGCGVRNAGAVPPRTHGSFAEPSPRKAENKTEAKRDLRWQREHLILTSKHLPSRAPLPDKGKPAVRRGRKATDQVSDLRAGLPEEE